MAKVYEIRNRVARDVCGIQRLVELADFTDAEIDAITSLGVGEQWSSPEGEVKVARLSDSKHPNVPGTRKYPRVEGPKVTARQRRQLDRPKE
jgi:hypothetical protein